MLQEQSMQFQFGNETIFGVLHRPKQPTARIVIMHHGFTGTSVDAHFMFARCARSLCEQGLAVLRYDFIGSGNSTGNFADMTYQSECSQAADILQQVDQWPWVDTIYLQGFSMGGALVAQLAGKYPTLINKVLLWSPAGSMPQIAAQIQKENLQLANGNYDCNGLEVSSVFIDEMLEIDLFMGIGQYQGEIQIIQGTQDQAVPWKTAEAYRQHYSQPVQIHYLEGADHTFSSLAWLEQLFELSSTFFRADEINT
ncbi:MAG: alpha/beta hydrolase family protein [Culicoidibacterales bacterium]